MWIPTLFLAFSASATTEMAEPNVEIESEVPFEVFRWEGRTRSETLCTAPCSLELPTGEPIKLGFTSPGVPPTAKVLRMAPEQTVHLEVRPGKRGKVTTGAVLMGLGTIAISSSLIIDQAGGQSGLALPVTGMALVALGTPFSLAGATKVRRR